MTWDGKDDQGNPLPSGNYQWRTITTSAVGQDSGNIGNNGSTLNGSVDPMEPEAMAYDSSGNLYMVSYYEEDGCTIRCYSAGNIGTDVTTWGTSPDGLAGGTAVATDGANVYCAVIAPSRGSILSYNASTGVATPGWTAIQVSTMNVPGLAVDGSYLWATDQAANAVKLYNKSTGAFIASYAVTNPRCIAADGNGNAWVASATTPTGSVIQLNTNGATLSATGRQITGLQSPCGVAYFVNGSTPYLYVTEANAGTIDQYNLSGTGTPTLADPWPTTYFGAAQPGAISNFKFYWPYDLNSCLRAGRPSPPRPLGASLPSPTTGTTAPWCTTVARRPRWYGFYRQSDALPGRGCECGRGERHRRADPVCRDDERE